MWNHALRYALLEEPFSIQRIRSDMTTRVNSRTIRDTLNTMVDCGWLDKESSQAHTWYPGPKADNIENCEDEFNSPTPDQSDRSVYSAVDRVSERYSDRVSNSANLVIEGVGGSHALGSHGPVEEYVKVPYKDGDPIQVALPRLRYESRVLVCREQDIVRDGDPELVGKRASWEQLQDLIGVHERLDASLSESNLSRSQDQVLAQFKIIACASLGATLGKVYRFIPSGGFKSSHGIVSLLFFVNHYSIYHRDSLTFVVRRHTLKLEV